MALGGKHVTATTMALLASLVASSKIPSFWVILMAYCGGFFIDFDHLLHRRTRNRIRGKEISGPKKVFLHSIIGTILFPIISAIFYCLGQTGWWLPMAAYGIHAILDTKKGKFFCGNNSYPKMVWFKWPYEFNMPGIDDREEEQVSLLFTMGGWLMLSFISSLMAFAAAITFIIIFIIMFGWPSRIKILAIFAIDFLLGLGWLVYFYL